jgi:uncharacterized OB-fold protein
MNTSIKTVTAYRCIACNCVMYPHHFRCLNCGERDFEVIEPQGKATLITYTILNELPWGIDERGRVLGVVEFENHIKAFGLIQSKNPKIGMKLEAGWSPVRVIGGEKIFGLTFKPSR